MTTRLMQGMVAIAIVFTGPPAWAGQDQDAIRALLIETSKVTSEFSRTRDTQSVLNMDEPKNRDILLFSTFTKRRVSQSYIARKGGRGLRLGIMVSGMSIRLSLIVTRCQESFPS